MPSVRPWHPLGPFGPHSPTAAAPLCLVRTQQPGGRKPAAAAAPEHSSWASTLQPRTVLTGHEGSWSPETECQYKQHGTQSTRSRGRSCGYGRGCCSGLVWDVTPALSWEATRKCAGSGLTAFVAVAVAPGAVLGGMLMVLPGSLRRPGGPLGGDSAGCGAWILGLWVFFLPAAWLCPPAPGLPLLAPPQVLVERLLGSGDGVGGSEGVWARSLVLASQQWSPSGQQQGLLRPPCGAGPAWVPMAPSLLASGAWGHGGSRSSRGVPSPLRPLSLPGP